MLMEKQDAGTTIHIKTSLRLNLNAAVFIIRVIYATRKQQVTQWKCGEWSREMKRRFFADRAGMSLPLTSI